MVKEMGKRALLQIMTLMLLKKMVLISTDSLAFFKALVFFIFLLVYWNIDSPFEFRALEVFLEAICSFLAARTTELETAAYPALDELTSKVGTLNVYYHHQ